MSIVDVSFILAIAIVMLLALGWSWLDLTRAIDDIAREHFEN